MDACKASLSGCPAGKYCQHESTTENCPYCGMPMVRVVTTGHMFCSNPDTVFGCDYEYEPNKQSA